MLISFVLLFTIVQPGASFENATAIERSGWTSSPNQRGTADILWTCFITLLTCSWTILHLNIPAKQDGALRRFFTQATWMVICIVAPEYITMRAFNQWYWASKTVPKMREIGYLEWHIVHGFYADMGGFVVQFDDDNSCYCGDSYYALDFDHLYWLIENGHLNVVDILVSEKDIRDRSHADVFTKSVTCLQASWIVLQCIARAAQQIPTSPLELATCAYVASALVTYWFWREKPFDTNQQWLIRRVVSKEAYSQMLRVFPEGKAFSGKGKPWRLGSLGARSETVIGNYVMCVVGLLFSTLHMAAWNYNFPSLRECQLWRIFTTMATASSGLLLLCMLPFHGSRYTKNTWFRWHTTSGDVDRGWEYKLSPIIILAGLVFLTARLYLIFAMFFCIRSMPSGVYDTVNWVIYIPHLS